MASEVATLVKEATALVGLIGEVAEVRGPAPPLRHSARSTPTRDTLSLSVSCWQGVSGIVSVAVSGATPLDFVQQSQGVGFGESLDILARRAGADLGPLSVQRTGPQRLDRIRWQTSGFCHELLRSDPSAARARAFLRRVHGYQSGDMAGVRIGWAPVDPSVCPNTSGGRLFAIHVGRVLYPVVTGPERVSGLPPGTPAEDDTTARWWRDLRAGWFRPGL
ncbi:MAG: hypothetical protein OXF41_20850 [bacterium]|nr:hypothetical protein [bacterium]